MSPQKKKGLGRGLKALFGDQKTSPEKILEKRIRVSNIRKIFILIYSQIRFLI